MKTQPPTPLTEGEERYSLPEGCLSVAWTYCLIYWVYEAVAYPEKPTSLPWVVQVGVGVGLGWLGISTLIRVWRAPFLVDLRGVPAVLLTLQGLLVGFLAYIIAGALPAMIYVVGLLALIWVKRPGIRPWITIEKGDLRVKEEAYLAEVRGRLRKKKPPF